MWQDQKGLSRQHTRDARASRDKLHRIQFVDIPRHIEAVMERHDNRPARSLEDLLDTDGWARAAARERIAAH